MTTTAAFEVGKTYTARSVCDHDCIFKATVTARRASLVTIKFMGNETTHRVKVDDGAEYLIPGKYSMAPCFRANRVAA